MPSPDRIFHSLMDFLKAPTWTISRQIASANQGLINVWVEMIDAMLNDRTTVLRTYPGRSLSDATALLKTHRNVLLRCQQIGVPGAFAELDRRMTRQPEPRIVATRTAGRGLAPIVLWAATLASAAPALLIIRRPGVFQSHYIHGYLGLSILFLPAATIIVQPVIRGYWRGRRRGFLIAVSIANVLAVGVFYLAVMNGALNGDRLMNATTQGAICYLGIISSIVALIAAVRRRT